MTKALKKWQPVISHLNVKEKYQEILAEYAEHHCELETNNLNISMNDLPLSMSVLSKILQEIDLHIEISKEPLNTINILTIKVDGDLFFQNPSMAIEAVENAAKDEIVKIFKKKLSNNTKLKIYKFISCSVNQSKQLVYTANVKFYSRIDKLERILNKN